MDRQAWVEHYGNEDALFVDGMDDYIIGCAERAGGMCVVAYSKQAVLLALTCVEYAPLVSCADGSLQDVPESRAGAVRGARPANVQFEQQDERTAQSAAPEDAPEYYAFNVLGAWMGDHTPVFVDVHIPAGK